MPRKTVFKTKTKKSQSSTRKQTSLCSSIYYENRKFSESRENSTKLTELTNYYKDNKDKSTLFTKVTNGNEQESTFFYYPKKPIKHLIPEEIYKKACELLNTTSLYCLLTFVSMHTNESTGKSFIANLHSDFEKVVMGKKRTMCTSLTILIPLIIHENHGGLIVLPKKTKIVVPYEVGNYLIIEGNLRHATQPFIIDENERLIAVLNIVINNSNGRFFMKDIENHSRVPKSAFFVQNISV